MFVLFLLLFIVGLMTTAVMFEEKRVPITSVKAWIVMISMFGMVIVGLMQMADYMDLKQTHENYVIENFIKGEKTRPEFKYIIDEYKIKKFKESLEGKK